MRSLRIRLTCSYVAIVLAVVTCITVMGNLSVRAVAARQVRHELQSKCELIGSAVDRLMGQAMSTVEMIAEAQTVESMDAEPIRMWLEEVHDGNPMLSSLVVLDANEQTHVAVGELGAEGGKVIVDQWPELVSAMQTTSRGEVVIAGPIDVGTGPVVAMLTPIIPDSRDSMAGVLCVVVPVGGAAELINSFDCSKHTAQTVFIVDGDGQVMISTGPLSSSPDLPQKFRGDRRTQPLPSDASGTLSYQSTDRTTVLAGYAQVGESGSISALNWSVVALVPEAAVMAPSRALTRNLAIISCVAVLLTIIVSIVIARRVTEPIAEVASRAEAIADGDLLGEPLAAMGGTEIESLVQSVNRMSFALTEAAAFSQQSAAAKDEFLANISHEIRTPMTAILGFIDLIEAGDGNDDPRRRGEAIATVRRNGEHLLTILNDILDLSRIKAGTMSIEKTPVSLIHMAEEVASFMRPRAESRGLRLECEYTTSIPQEVRTDPVRLRQILNNVVGNAIKFTETGKVTIRTRYEPDAGRLTIEVIDTGIGMDDAQRSQIFEAFSQADYSLTRKFSGAGMGLRISGQLADMLGGDLKCESRPGKGSLFTISIDAETIQDTSYIAPEQIEAFLNGSELEDVPEEDATPSEPLSGRRILLAEDGPDNRRLISFHLEKAGAIVSIAENGSRAVWATDDAIRNGVPFDMILMDMQMPEMDGYTATGLIRRHGHELPIVALTAHAMAGDREKCLAAGCDDYLSKPVKPRDLLQCCCEALENGVAARARSS